MSELFDAYKKDVNGFPSDFIPEDKKDDKYALQFAKAAFSQHVRDECAVLYSKHAEMMENRAYGNGNQDPSEVMGLHYQWDKSKEEKKGYVNLSADKFTVLPKFKSVFIGMSENMLTRAEATAIDESSVRNRDLMMKIVWYKKQFKEEIDFINETLGINQDEQPYLPDNIEELNMFNDLGAFKLENEVAIEKLIDYSFYISDWPEIRRQILGDLFDNSVGGAKTYFDSVENKMKARRVDPLYAVVDHSNDSKFKNSRFFGELVPYNISDLASESGFGEEKLREIAMSYKGLLNNPMIDNWEISYYNDNNLTYPWYDYKIWVLDLEFKSVNRRKKTERKVKGGNVVVYDEKSNKVYDDEKRKTAVYDIEAWYKCKWVLGTEYVYDFDVLENQARSSDNKRAYSSFQFYRIDRESPVSLAKEMAKQCHLIHMKIQNIVIKTPPGGIAVEYGSLENINLGNGTLKPLELLKVFAQTGNYVYKATTHRNGLPGPQYKPFERLVGGSGGELQEQLALMDWYFEKIRDVTGINRLADASTPSPEQSVSGAQMAVQATVNALNPMFSAYVNIQERTARNLISRIKTFVRYSGEDYNGYFPVIGKSNMENIRITSDILSSDYGIKIEVKSTERLANDTRLAAVEAMKSGKNGVPLLDFADYLKIVKLIDNGQVDLAQFYMSKKTQQNQIRDLTLQRENMQLNSQSALATEKAKSESKRREMILEKNLELRNKLLEINAEKIKRGDELELKGIIDQMLMFTERDIESSHENVKIA